MPLIRFPTRLLAVLAAAVLAAPALAAHYTLAEGAVSFDVPDNWTAIMEKPAGDPQFYAFQVPNPSSPQLSRVTVTAHRLNNPGDFPAWLTQEMGKANQSKGFAQAKDPLPGEHSLHYQFLEDNTPQDVQLALFSFGQYAVVLRCQRPQKDKASTAWLAAYHQACTELARQLGP